MTTLSALPSEPSKVARKADLHINLEPEIKDAIEAHNLRTGSTFAGVVRVALTEFLGKGEQNK